MYKSISIVLFVVVCGAIVATEDYSDLGLPDHTEGLWVTNWPAVTVKSSTPRTTTSTTTTTEATTQPITSTSTVRTTTSGDYEDISWDPPESFTKEPSTNGSPEESDEITTTTEKARTPKPTTSSTSTSTTKRTTTKSPTTTKPTPPVTHPPGTTFFRVNTRNSDQMNCGRAGVNSKKKCVSWYLCKNSSIVTDGSFLIDERGDFSQPDKKLCPSMETCCGPDDELPAVDRCESGAYKKPTKCGIRNVNGFGDKLSGDKYAKYGEFPWMMAVLYQVEGENMNKLWKYKAGGSLIHPKLVVTARHRLHDISASDLKVRGGEWNTRSEHELCKIQEREVADAISHEDYDPRTKENNIMLLVLKEAFEISAVINPICLPEDGYKFERSNQSCYGTGWGAANFGNQKFFQNFLKKVDMPVVEKSECQRRFDARPLIDGKLTVGRTSLCAGGQLGKDMCTGDGGSPLACRHPLKPEGEKYYLAGIVTAGDPKGCGQANLPGIYEDVTKHVEWIWKQQNDLKISNDY